MNKLIEFSSERLIYEPLGLKHLSNNYVKWLNDIDVIRFMESGGDYSIKKLEKYLINQERKKIFFWAIKLKKNGKHIGYIISHVRIHIFKIHIHSKTNTKWNRSNNLPKRNYDKWAYYEVSPPVVFNIACIFDKHYRKNKLSVRTINKP